MRDIMSQALVALPALAQINLLSPVNTPFPGRIWASDTFIFSGIWENTRGGFARHSVRRQAWAPSASPASVRLRPLASRNPAGVRPGRMNPPLCDAAVFFVWFAAQSALSQGCHPENSWPCFVAFTHFRHSMCLIGCFGWWAGERFSTGDAPDRLSARAGAQTRRQNTIC